MRRAAFTLVELLVATALTVVLMLGVLAVLAELRPPAQSSEPGEPVAPAGFGGQIDQAAFDSLANLLAEDLRQTQTAETPQANLVSLTGCISLDTGNRGRDHRPVSVTYELATIQGRNWLLRRQAALDVPSIQNVQRDLVATGVTRFALTSEYHRPPDVAATPLSPAPAPASPNQRSSGSGRNAAAPISNQKSPVVGWVTWSLQVWCDAGPTPAFSRTVAVLPREGL